MCPPSREIHPISSMREHAFYEVVQNTRLARKSVDALTVWLTPFHPMSRFIPNRTPCGQIRREFLWQVGVTDELGFKAIENRCHFSNHHATILHLTGVEERHVITKALA